MSIQEFRGHAPSHAAAAMLGLLLLTGGENVYSKTKGGAHPPRTGSPATAAPLPVSGSFDSTYTVLDTIADTTITTSILDPNSVAALKTTAAYASCMASTAKKCDVCHVPEGDAAKANVLNVLKAVVATHNGHHGDYVTTDHTCDLYKPKTTISISYHTVPRTVHITVDHANQENTSAATR